MVFERVIGRRDLARIKPFREYRSRGGTIARSPGGQARGSKAPGDRREWRVEIERNPAPGRVGISIDRNLVADRNARHGEFIAADDEPRRTRFTF